ncbi:MAG: hypothetical protein EBS97_01615 [Verrucomicrobia bacterium]|nr:hypothetical protein [Verrucomicrobiota bacterium]
MAKGENMTTATSTAPTGGTFKERYPHGYTLLKRERNLHDDSYFYEIIWLADLKKTETIDTGSTAYDIPDAVAGQSGLPTIFEAPAEVQAEFRAYAREKALETRKRWAEGVANAYIESFNDADDVIVVKAFKNGGVKYEVGTKGKVFWHGAGYLKHSPRRIGFKLADGTKVFTNEDNVEKLTTLAIDEQAVHHWVHSIDEHLDKTDIKSLLGYVTGIPHTTKDFQERKAAGEQFVLRVFG